MMAEQPKTSATNNPDSLLSGSTWITASGIISRALSALYVIPWNIWMGSALIAASANALYGKVYHIYDFFLLISTAGLPSAISKQISHYNALGEYEAGNQLFKQALKVTAIIGVVFAGIMYFGAPEVAQVFTNGDPRSIPAIKALAIAILLLPTLSIMRGYFQGYSLMEPSALSMMFEQLVRVCYMLAITYITMQIRHGNYVDAVTKSTFASFVGASASILYLLGCFWRRRHYFRDLATLGSHNLQFTARDFTKEIVQQAIPFVIIDSTITIFNLFDQSTFNWMMQSFMRISQQQLDYYYSLFGFQANKLIMVIVSLATGVVSSSIPLVSSLYTQQKTESIKQQIRDILCLFMFFMLPAALGMLAVARPLWITFYAYSALGIKIMRLSCVMALLIGLFMVLSAILQALYKNGLAIRYLGIGFVVKIIIQWPLVYWLQAYGPIWATICAMIVICALMVTKINRLYPLPWSQILRRNLWPLIALAIVMLLVVWGIDGLVGLLDTTGGRLRSTGYLMLEIIIGAFIYGYWVLKKRSFDQNLHISGDKLRNKLHIK